MRSPKANVFAERFVRTVRQECLGHLPVVSRRHLESVLDGYVRHYNDARPHRGLQLTQPNRNLVTPSGDVVVRRDILSGLIDEYERTA